jgi:hypothetical protein
MGKNTHNKLGSTAGCVGSMAGSRATRQGGNEMSEQEVLQEILATLQRMEKQQDDELRRQAKERSKALQPQRKLSRSG